MYQRQYPPNGRKTTCILKFYDWGGPIVPSLMGKRSTRNELFLPGRISLLVTNLPSTILV